MPMILRLLVLCVVVLTGAVQAEDKARPEALLADQHLTGRFEHERRVVGFDVPLSSTGSMVLTGQGELIWRIESPYAAELVVTPTAIVQFVDGRAAMRIPTGSAGQLGQINELLIRVLTGDWSGLGFRRVEEAGGWSAVGEGAALPGILAAQIREIRARGGRFVEEVTVTRSNGDVERFRFFDHAIRSEPPSEIDRAALDRGHGG